MYFILLILKIIIRTCKIYIILKLLTLSDILVFSARVAHETVQPLVLEGLAGDLGRSTKMA
jgi:hypothetical protein